MINKKINCKKTCWLTNSAEQMPNGLGLHPQNSDYFPSGQPDRVSLEECSGLNPLATPVLNWTQLPNRLYTYSHKHASEKLVLAGCPDVSLKRGQHQRFFNLSPSINQHFSADKRAISQVPLLIPSCRSGFVQGSWSKSHWMHRSAPRESKHQGGLVGLTGLNHYSHRLKKILFKMSERGA